MPPASRNHRTPTTDETPASTPAASLRAPRAIAAQNRWRCSRRPTGGRPGECIAGRPARSDALRFLPIATPLDQALRRPLESAQYIGLTFGQAAHDAGIAQSMGAVGSCFDNAVAETFFATLTKERLLHDVPQKGWATRAELRSAIFEYIEGFYNPTRLHSTLGMRSPVEFETDHAAGDSDGLARAGTCASAREKSVHNLRLRTATTTTST